MSSASASASAVDEIRWLVAAAATHQSDPDPFLALHAPEAIVVNIAGRRVLGRDHLATAMRAALDGSLASVTTTVDVDDVRFVRPDVAIVSCTKHVHDARTTDHAALPSAGALTYVVARTDGRWEIALAQTTPVRT